MEINGISNAVISSRYASTSENTHSTFATQAAQASNTTTSPAENLTTQSVNATSAQESAENNTNDLNAAVDKVKQFVSSATNGIEFSVDKDLGRTVVKIVDRETSETIRQIPSQDMIDLAKALDKIQGLLIKQQV